MTALALAAAIAPPSNLEARVAELERRVAPPSNLPTLVAPAPPPFTAGPACVGGSCPAPYAPARPAYRLFRR